MSPGIKFVALVIQIWISMMSIFRYDVIMATGAGYDEGVICLGIIKQSMIKEQIG
jgi:hypothetical protein